MLVLYMDHLDFFYVHILQFTMWYYNYLHRLSYVMFEVLHFLTVLNGYVYVHCNDHTNYIHQKNILSYYGVDLVNIVRLSHNCFHAKIFSDVIPTCFQPRGPKMPNMVFSLFYVEQLFFNQFYDIFLSFCYIENFV